MAYGMIAVISGLPVWAAVLISLTNLTSAGQFAGTNLMVAAGGYIEIAITTFIINIRYFLMSLSLSQKVDDNMTTGQRLAASFGITDEIFAVAIKRTVPVTGAYMAGLIITPVIGWTGGTFFGAALTSFVPQIISNSFGIALYGMFIAIIIPVAKEQKSVLFTVLLATVLSVLVYYIPFLSFLSGGWDIILITVSVSAIAAVLFPVKEGDELTEDELVEIVDESNGGEDK